MRAFGFHLGFHRLRMKTGSTLRLLLAVFSALLLVFIINTLMPTLTAPQTFSQVSLQQDDENHYDQLQTPAALVRKSAIQPPYAAVGIATDAAVVDRISTESLQEGHREPTRQHIIQMQKPPDAEQERWEENRRKLLQRHREALERPRGEHDELLQQQSLNRSRGMWSSNERYIPELGIHDDVRYYHGFTLLSEAAIASVESFVFFVGWQRSGHSIIGSLLDGHPDAVIAHEFFLFNHLQRALLHRRRSMLFNQLAANSYKNSRVGYRSQLHNEKGYNLKLSDSWQGRFRHLKVIGDKSAGETTSAYIANPEKFGEDLLSLKAMVRVPLKIINVIRNPYDMIATLSLYRGSGLINVKVPATAEKRYTNQTVIQTAAYNILNKAYFLHEMLQRRYDWELFQMYSEDFIADPRSVMSDLCTFLSLECTEDYLTQCAEKTFKSTSKTRELIEWDPDTVEQVEKAIKTLPFFRHYSN